MHVFALIAGLAGAVWLGGSAALVTSAEIDRRLHPLDYPLPYEVDLLEPEMAPGETAPSAELVAPIAPTPIAGCVL